MSEETNADRRRADRHSVAPMYSVVSAQSSVGDSSALEGHAYDISASGVRIELDQPLQLGERVAMKIGLPGTELIVAASGDVVWVNDELDDPGPRRMALRFADFVSQDDHDRLMTYLDGTQLRQAA